MATLYLHIGMPKTGTTAIQNFLTDNAEALNKHGICYPDLGFRYPSIGIPRNAHFLIASYIEENGKKTHRRPAAEYEPGLDQLADLARRYDRIILSDEAIWRGSTTREDFWPRLKEDLAKRSLDLKIIVYLRRQDLWVQSFWAQKVKKGTTMTFQEYLKYMDEVSYPVNYYPYMDMLASVFGKDALVIRLYEKEQYEGEQHSLLSDFLNIFGVPLSEDFTMKKEFYNPSLAGNSIEMRRLLNNLPDIDRNSHALKQAIRDLQTNHPDTGIGGSYTWHDTAEQSSYLNSFAESNSRVAREFLDREDGQLFWHPVDEVTTPYSDRSSLNSDMFLVCSRAIQILEEDNKRLESQLKATKAELKELRENVLFYRLKRKLRHISGKDQTIK
jgi:hypothetical protein